MRTGLTAMQVDLSRSRGIAGWMTDEELAWLGEQALTRSTIVEMGCYQGRSTCILAENTPGLVYAWDNWKGPQEEWWLNISSEAFRKSLYGKFTANLDDFIKAGKVVIVHADHSDAGARQTIPDPDMVFIDGDHHYEGVIRDIRTWLPAKAGTVICGHDFAQPSVRDAVLEHFPQAKQVAGKIWSATV